MPIDSNLIGASSTPEIFEVTRKAVLRFMEATEDPALQSGTVIEYAPPTFPTTFRSRVPGLELDGSRMQLVHGEQQYTYTRKLRIGEKITCVARIADIRERAGKSGAMTLVVSEIIGTDERQQPVFTGRSTTIVREK
jgi:N-terminal half of MaoC dehydratase